MKKITNKKFIALLLVPFFLLGLTQSVGAITKLIGETATITVTCSDVDGNLTECNVTSPCSQDCSASGSSGNCSCQFTCVSAETYDACGEAIDQEGGSDLTCLPGELQCIANQPPDKPEVPGIYQPSGASWTNCSFRDKSIPTFHWTYDDPDGDPQAAYEIWIDSSAGFPDPKFNNLVNLAATAYALDLSQDDDSDWLDELNWNTKYWWKVKVKDDQDNWSVWSDTFSFTTPLHAYPWSGFSWLPQDPSQDEVVVFTPEETGFYYLWTITEGEGVYTNETGPTSEEPHIKFLTTTNKIKLEVTDFDAYSCESSEQEITAQLPLPEYKETAPIIWLKKFWSNLAGFFNGFLTLSNG